MNNTNSKLLLFQPFTLDDLLNKNFPDSQWIAEQVIPVGITAVSGIPGRGKTWLVHQIAISVSTGEALFGQYDVSQTGVLILDKENSPQLLQDRFKLLGATKDLLIHFESMGGNLINDQYISAILTYCKLSGIGLVIFDSLIRFHGAKENDASEMARVFDCLKQLPNNGISVIFNQHHRKEGNRRGDPGDSMRGSTDILAAVDCHLVVEKENDTMTLIQSKLRIGKQLQENIQLLLDSTKPDRVYMKYVGGVRKRGQKEEHIKVAIKKVLAVEPLNQNSLHKSLKDKDIKVGLRTLGKYLKNMVADDSIKSKQGPRNSTIYSVPSDKPEEGK